VLVFDNSYSKLTSKRLTFWTDIKAGIRVFCFQMSFSTQSCQWTTSRQSQTWPDGCSRRRRSRASRRVLLSLSSMLCFFKPRFRGAAWSKRWCQLNQGVLTYYERPGAYCRGTIDLASATIAVIMRTRQINIDNGVLLFHLKGTLVAKKKKKD